MGVGPAVRGGWRPVSVGPLVKGGWRPVCVGPAVSGGWRPVCVVPAVGEVGSRWVLDRLLGKIGGCLSFLFSSGVCWTGYEGRLQAACLVSYL
ncbi:hypothetical protein AB205_0068920, partial [Aquarana catesbeiana]